jgi:hypothetical protein
VDTKTYMSSLSLVSRTGALALPTSVRFGATTGSGLASTGLVVGAPQLINGCFGFGTTTGLGGSGRFGPATITNQLDRAGEAL